MILVTGATGFLGRHLMPRLLARYGSGSAAGVSSKDYDLLDPCQVRRMFDDRKPEVVIHLAAYSGGIGANCRRPADFFYRNTLLTTLMFQQCAERGVRKLLYTMGGCSYPASARSPIDEGQMWQGFPQPESAGYSCAKKMGIVAALAYRQQYGLDSVVLVPGNMYGEYDNFRHAESHVAAAMIRRFHEAKQTDCGEVVMWGTGRPVRDFVYAGDVAAVLAEFVDGKGAGKGDCPPARKGTVPVSGPFSIGPINVSTGTSTAIGDLAGTIRRQIGFAGSVRWDASKPDGQMVKIFDVARLNRLGLRCPTPLGEGLARTIRWFEANCDAQSDGIRL